MECEYLKRWFGSLTEQNRRLQREVEELRAKKVGPPTVLTPHSREPLPASTLTMCPRCERVTTTTITSTATRVVDKGGPTTATQAGNPNLSAKTLQLLHPRHPSAAC
nr:homeobox-leucine zipper protein HOX3 [Ipomoea batatas]